jgi:ABC-type spermidine/putrescine transport system permease subunit II
MFLIATLAAALASALTVTLATALVSALTAAPAATLAVTPKLRLQNKLAELLNTLVYRPAPITALVSTHCKNPNHSTRSNFRPLQKPRSPV